MAQQGRNNNTYGFDELAFWRPIDAENRPVYRAVLRESRAIQDEAQDILNRFSGLSMINEDAAFFMSVDTPFMEPETGIALLDAIGDADICMVRGKAGYLDPATAAYSKNCIPTIGKSLILRQFTFDALREKCKTVCVTEKALAACTDIPVDRQFFNLDTRQDYYQALKIYLQL